MANISRERSCLTVMISLGIAFLFKPYLDSGLKSVFDTLASRMARREAKDLLEINRGKWQAKNLKDYRYRFGIDGHYSASLAFDVHGGKQTSFSNPGGTTIDSYLVNRFDTIDKIFQVAQDKLNSGAAEVNIRYDPKFGFPSLIEVDESKEMWGATHDEYGYYASRFEVLK